MRPCVRKRTFICWRPCAGGAYFEDADGMHLRRVVAADNTASGHGGAFAIDRAVVRARGCEVCVARRKCIPSASDYRWRHRVHVQLTRNSAGGNGGGVWVGPAGTLDLATMQGGGVGYTAALTANVAGVSGGGIASQGVVRLAGLVPPVSGGGSRQWLAFSGNVAKTGSGGGLFLNQVGSGAASAHGCLMT